MKIGTKSVLFGAHQFLLHPWFVALAWWRLYGFPWDPRLWVAFFVHDLGYIGKPNMDGPEGEWHVYLGAQIMGDLFDDEPLMLFRRFARLCDWLFGSRPERRTWFCFSFYHSRHMAKQYGADYSRLCVADKLATALTPWWLYSLTAGATGEIAEYMRADLHEHGAKYSRAEIEIGSGQRRWFDSMQAYQKRWVEAHRDGCVDNWTPEVVRE